MLLGQVVQVASDTQSPPRAQPGDRVATLVSLSLTPLRIDRIRAVRRASAQIDVEGEAVLFASGGFAKMPHDFSQRLALALFDVAGAAPQVMRMVAGGTTALVLGAGGKSGILCAAAAKKRGARRVIGVESHAPYAAELTKIGVCDVVIAADARDPVLVRRLVLQANDGNEVDTAFSCVNVPDAEMSAILCTRDRGKVYFFAMSTSFTKAALGAEGAGKDVDLYIGNGYALGHAEQTLALVRDTPAVRELFSTRYG
jgi:L-erythro-3,5-diaminohexanoate dehydrogenase